MRLVNKARPHIVFSIAAFIILSGLSVQAQTSKYISEVEYNTINKGWLNPQNIQLLPYINVNNIFLYNKSFKIWKGSLNGNLRFSLLNQLSKDEVNKYDVNDYKIRFDPNELYYQKSFNNFTLGIGRKGLNGE